MICVILHHHVNVVVFHELKKDLMNFLCHIQSVSRYGRFKEVLHVILCGCVLLHRLLAWVCCPLVIVALVNHYFGHISALLFLGQAVAAVLMVESYGYLSHYGLTRKMLENGRYVQLLH